MRLHGDCRQRVHGCLGTVRKRICARKLHVAAHFGELHLVDFHAEVAARLCRLGEVHGELAVLVVGGDVEVRSRHQVVAGEHRCARVARLAGRALRQGESNARDLLVGIGLAFPGDARLHAAEHVRRPADVGFRSAFGGIERIRVRRGDGNLRRTGEHERERDEQCAKRGAHGIRFQVLHVHVRSSTIKKPSPPTRRGPHPVHSPSG